MQEKNTQTPVWDPFVRFHHWALVSSYLVAWASADDFVRLHEQVGYFMMILIILRLFWGVLGSRYARFSDFLYSPAKTMAYLASLKEGRPEHYTGHNPAGGWMIMLLLLTLSGTIATGILMGGMHDSPWEDVHEGLANLTVLLVVVHVSGVVVSGLLHGENLVRAMITGYKKAGGSDE